MLNVNYNQHTLEKLIINFLIKDRSQVNFKFKSKIIGYIKSDYFFDQTIETIFKIVKRYFKEYNSIPNTDEVKQLAEIQNFNISTDYIDELLDYSIGKYKQDYIYGWIKTFIISKRTQNTFLEINSKLKEKNITPDNVQEELNELIDYFNQNININFDTFGNVGDFDNAEHHYQPELQTTSSGFRFFDTVIGGWNPKTLVCFSAKPKCGKSSILGNIAVRCALKGHNVGVATNELSKAAYLKRIGTNILSIKDEEYDKFANQNNGELQNRINEKKAQFYNRMGYEMGKIMVEEFIDNTVTASTIENLYVDLENSLNIKFQVIVVDYLNLLSAEKRTYNMYERIKFIAEELRKIAMRNNWCIISATQVKREFYEKENLPMGSSAESSGLEATVDALFGIIRPEFTNNTKIQSIAQRERAKYTGSYAIFNFSTDYNRLIEINSAEAEYYPTQSEGVIEKEINNKQAEQGESNIDSESVDPTPNNDSEEVVFDNEF
jgi:replicative DNA helicase